MTYEEAYRIAADWAVSAHKQREETDRCDVGSRFERANYLGVIPDSHDAACQLFYSNKNRRNTGERLELRDHLSIIHKILPIIQSSEVGHEQARACIWNGRDI